MGCRQEKKQQRNALIIVLSLCKCFGEEEEGEQLFSFLREEQETSGLILESVTFRLKAASEDLKRWLLAVGRGRGALPGVSEEFSVGPAPHAGPSPLWLGRACVWPDTRIGLLHLSGSAHGLGTLFHPKVKLQASYPLTPTPSKALRGHADLTDGPQSPPTGCRRLFSQMLGGSEHSLMRIFTHLLLNGGCSLGKERKGQAPPRQCQV